MSTNEMTSKVRELKELQQLIDEATAEAEEIKDQIKAEMTARNTDEMTVDVFKVRWTPVTSKRFDSKAFQKDHADTYGLYLKESTTRRFCVA